MAASIEEILGRYQRLEDELIPILQDIQKSFGYLSPQQITRVSRHLRMSANRIYGVSSFYAQFRFTPPGRHSIRVCLGTACHVRSGAILLEVLERDLEIKSGQTTQDGRYDLDRVACLGCCALSPVLQIDSDIYSRVSVNKLKELLGRYE